VMKSQHSYISLVPIEQFDQILAAYHGAVGKNPGKFGNLKLSPKTTLHATN
jgi:hypothetical protein